MTGRRRARLHGPLRFAVELAVAHVTPVWARLLVVLAQRARRQSGWHG